MDEINWLDWFYLIGLPRIWSMWKKVVGSVERFARDKMINGMSGSLMWIDFVEHEAHD